MSALLAAVAVVVVLVLLLPRPSPAEPDRQAPQPPGEAPDVARRAEAIFWKWIEARSSGDREGLVDLCVSYPKGDAPTEKLCLLQLALSGAAIGKAELVSLREEEGKEVADVQISWSASVDGQEPEDIVHVFTLSRSQKGEQEWLLLRVGMPEQET